MKRFAILLFLVGCDGASLEGGVIDRAELLGTWQAPNATLALTPHLYPDRPSFAYVAPNGAIVMGTYSVDGNRLSLEGFPQGTFAVSGDTLIVSLPDSTVTYRRAATYCVATSATQSCQ